MNASDRTYYLRRILQEQEAARVAMCPEARERHEELADAYRLRCRMDSEPPFAIATSEGFDPGVRLRVAER
jgi:hypothetical protein